VIARPRPGFTIAEALIAVVVGVMVAGLAMQAMISAARSLARSEERLDPRETVMISLSTMRAALQDSWQYTVTRDGSGLSFSGPSGAGELRFDRATRRLLVRAPGAGAVRALSIWRLESFRITSVLPGLLRVSLDVERMPAGQLAGLGTLRVVDDILVPAVAFRDGSIPWTLDMEPAAALEPTR
jgi:hypothetical protein